MNEWLDEWMVVGWMDEWVGSETVAPTRHTQMQQV